MTSGTSATRCSPAAVSFGTPIRIAGAGTYPIGQPDDGRGAVPPVRASRYATLGASSMTVNLTRIYTKLRRRRGDRISAT